MRATVATVALVALGLVLAHYAVEQFATHVFKPETLHAIVRKAVAANEDQGPDAVIADVVAQLKKTYPDHIVTGTPYILNVAGGAMGAMKILHCSLSEYIIIFGSPTGTEGHSGRHLADDYFHILYGEQHAAAPGKLLPEIYRPGDLHLMRRGVAKQYKMPGATWALEYARGDIVSMFPFGLADSVLSTIDPITILQTIYYSASLMLHELVQFKI